MTLPPYIARAFLDLAATLITHTHADVPVVEVVARRCIVAGRLADVDPAWLAAVAIGESGLRGPNVAQVEWAWAPRVADLRTPEGSVYAAAMVYRRIVAKHGRRDAHLLYGCGVDRCGGVWNGAARWKRAVWRQLVLTRREAQGE